MPVGILFCHSVQLLLIVIGFQKQPVVFDTVRIFDYTGVGCIQYFLPIQGPREVRHLRIVTPNIGCYLYPAGSQEGCTGNDLIDVVFIGNGWV